MRALVALMISLAAALLPPAAKPQPQPWRPRHIEERVQVPSYFNPATNPAQSEKPLFRFGLIADVQYADKDARGIRRYRESAVSLQQCVAELNRHPLAFSVNLGDLIDGNGMASRADLAYILKLLDPLKARLYHVIGNHCLAIDRPELLRMLHLKNTYYAFQKSGWRFLVLDGMDVSVASPPGSRESEQAKQYLQKDPKLPDYNGAIGAKQMAWLREQLSSAKRSNQKAVVFCHHPVLPAGGNDDVVLWNYQDVLHVLENSGCVVAYVCGHYHPGSYAEQNGIHHVTIPGMVESPEKSNRFAIVSVFRDSLQIQGFGTVPSRVLRLGPAREIAVIPRFGPIQAELLGSVIP
ncbi:MAG: cyclic 3',5'-adenosine monophosphate phosphodiesterase [Acidobacteria bacterium]|nr:cyclic 3',5'-adenosine monophosphate phosphodiesterase [Acidobacteriota bacterium]